MKVILKSLKKENWKKNKPLKQTYESTFKKNGVLHIS